ncbi:MAG: hypothetical protein H6838_18540 [Planctomycetes bacterium]|nr:hypothetical protein [Planctomycetota bacterium]
MTPSPALAIAAFARRSTAAVFGVSLSRGLLVAALALAAAQLGVRLTGGYLAPSWHWAWAALPVVAYAWWRARRQRLSPALAAAHLDRRLGLGGLLLAAHDGNELDATYAAQLSRGLQGAGAAAPHALWSQALPRPLAASALAAVLALLPPPAAHAAPAPAELATAQLEQLTAAMRDLFERGAVPERFGRSSSSAWGRCSSSAPKPDRRPTGATSTTSSCASTARSGCRN